MATPEGVARVKENKVATKQLKETFERMKELEARSKQHQVLEERLKRISLVLEKQKQEEEAQRLLALEIAQKNEEVLKQNQRIIEELAKLEHEEKVREEVLKARQVVRQQYAIEVEDLRYKGLSDIPKEQLLDMKESEEKVDLLKVPVLSDIPQVSRQLRTPKGEASQRQSFQKSSVSQKVTSKVPQASPEASRSPLHTKLNQVAASKRKSTSISSSVSGMASKTHTASKEPKPVISLKQPKEIQHTGSSYKAPKAKETASAYSSNGIPTKFSTQAKEKSPRLVSREHVSISDRKKPSWNSSTNHSSARRGSDLTKEPPTEEKTGTPKKQQLKSQQAQQSALSVLTKKVEHLKAEKRAAKGDTTSSSKTPTKRDNRPDSSRNGGQRQPSHSRDLHGLIPNIKKDFEPALARSRTPKAREGVKLKKEVPSERNSQDTDQTSCFGTLAPQAGLPNKQYHSRPGDHLDNYVRQEPNYFTEPAGLSFQEGFSAHEPLSRGSGEPPRPFIKPVPLLAESEVMIPAAMARDVSESELQTTGTFLQATEELKAANSAGHSGTVLTTGPQHIKLVWSSANLGSAHPKTPDMH